MFEQNKTTLSLLVKRLSKSKFLKTLSGAMLIAILSRLSSLGMAIILARQLSPSGYGAFTYAIGIAMIASQISSMGWPVLMSRFIPQYLVLKEWGLLKGLILKGELIVIISSVVTSAAFLYFGKIGYFDHDISQGLVLAAALIPALSVLTLRKSQLAAQKKTAVGLFFKEFLPPTTMILFSFLFFGSDVSKLFFIFAGLNYLAVLAASFATYNSLPKEMYACTSTSNLKQWMAVSLPLIAAVSGKMIMSKSDILMLMPLSNVQEVGYYGAVFRVTYLLTFVQVVLMTVMSPLISEAIALKNMALIKRRFFGALVIAVCTSVPIAIFMLIFKSQIIEIVFGAEYLQGVSSLVFLIFAQTVVSLNMPLTSLMMMAGREKIYGTLMVSSLVLNLYLNWLFIPLQGAEGAAKATLIASCFNVIFGIIICASIMNKFRSELS